MFLDWSAGMQAIKVDKKDSKPVVLAGVLMTKLLLTRHANGLISEIQDSKITRKFLSNWVLLSVLLYVSPYLLRFSH